MKNCAFTICTKSYQGIANTVRDTFLEYHNDFDFYIVIVDDDKQENYILCADVILQKYLESNILNVMKFQYDLTEYCTSIKAYCCKYFLDSGYHIAAYIDPDIMFYSRFNELYDEKYHVYLTPHILTLNATQLENESNLRCGIYNCGFIAFRKSQEADLFLNWWGQALITSCFDDSKRGLYTDQKWSNYIPVYFETEVCCIVKRLGCNIAPWNFFEREVICEDNRYYVIERKEKTRKDRLCFVHYSGFNYAELASSGSVMHGFRLLQYYDDLQDLFKFYGDELNKHNIGKYLTIAYKYNYFSNGTIIHPFHRRLFEAMKGTYLDNPFDVDGTFYGHLKKKGLLVTTGTEKVATNIRNVSGLGKKEKILKLFYLICLKTLGFEKYAEFLKGLKIYSREDHQTWLLSKKK